jgi:sugar-phosphatase
MPTFRCSAILFDLDGVLVTSTEAVSRQWRRWADENGVDAVELLKIAHGRRTAEVVRQLAPHLDIKSEVQKIEKREAEDTDGVVVMPGAVELVRSIPEGQWCVVTSGTRYLATSRLRLANIEIPRVLVSADDVNDGKPHPEPYLKGAQMLGFPPEECLVIEDAPAGIEAAHAGGMRVIALPSTYPVHRLNQADAVVDSLRQVHVRRLDGGAALSVEIET